MVIWRLAALLSFCIILGSVGSTAAQAEDTAAQAAAAYNAGRYGEAIQLFESMITADKVNAALHFNLGNAYFQAGQLGRALLNYRRAQQQLPRDADVDAAIARVVSQRRDVIGDDARLLAQVALLTTEVMTSQELAWAALMCWVLFCGLLVFGVLNTVKSLHINHRQFVMAVAVVLIVVLALLGVRVAFEALQPPGIVVVDQAVVMSGPGVDYLRLYILLDAAEVYILEKRGGWIRFGLADGRQGWVVADALEAVNR